MPPGLLAERASVAESGAPEMARGRSILLVGEGNGTFAAAVAGCEHGPVVVAATLDPNQFDPVATQKINVAHGLVVTSPLDFRLPHTIAAFVAGVERGWTHVRAHHTDARLREPIFDTVIFNCPFPAGRDRLEEVWPLLERFFHFVQRCTNFLTTDVKVCVSAPWDWLCKESGKKVKEQMVHLVLQARSILGGRRLGQISDFDLGWWERKHYRHARTNNSNQSAELFKVKTLTLSRDS